LHIGGDGLARGYLNRPELTAEKFVANPFVSGARIYKTGDLSRFLPDGSVECLGRVDHQVKVRGFRIEPGEIENVLRQYPAVAEALVTAREDHFGDKRLVGYVVSRSGPPSVTQLREHLRTRLPHHMVPAQFVVLKSFPLTPNGKVNVSALPAPEAQNGSSVSRVLPRTELEKALAGIFQEVLELKEVGIEDNFFDLGGDSLSATRAYARINRSFGANLSLREMLDRPTVARLADLVKSAPAVFSPVHPQIKRQPRSFDRA
jgi:fengycin family lipopeptide synthetase D